MLTSNNLTAISLFSGAGGDTIGMKNTGIDVIGFVEFDKYAIETHKKNFPDCKLIGENIKDVKDSEFKNTKELILYLVDFLVKVFNKDIVEF